MLTWWCTAPPSSRTSPLRPAKVPSSSSRSSPTVFAEARRRSRLFVARRNGVGMYTVTAMLASARLALPLAQVPLAGVWEHGHDELLGAEFRRDGAGGERCGTGGDAHQQPLLACEPSRPPDRVLVADHDDPIDDAPVQDAGHEGRADPLDRVGPRPAAREDRRLRRLDGDHAHARKLLLEHLAHPGHRAPGADARDERVEAAGDRV